MQEIHHHRNVRFTSITHDIKLHASTKYVFLFKFIPRNEQLTAFFPTGAFLGNILGLYRVI